MKVASSCVQLFGSSTMAKPAFIYAFDNLGPYRFVELCGEVFGSRYTGFLLGGEGKDGGVDAQIDKILGQWHPEEQSVLLNEIIQPGQDAIFQFKHKVVGRVGEAASRSQLLGLYKCNAKTGKVCELHGDLIKDKHPSIYILVTNVEVNSQYRDTFIEQCRNERPDIENFQVIGLDDLVNWITMMPELRHLYFPTIFGLPRFDLRLNLATTVRFPTVEINRDEEYLNHMLSISILNVGTIPSYLDNNSIKFQFNVDGKEETVTLFYPHNEIMRRLTPQTDDAIEPGRKRTYQYPFSHFREVKKKGVQIFPIEVQVHDQIGNIYSEMMPEKIRKIILEYLAED